MSDSKKPDQVVFNEESQEYDAFSRDHITNLSGPKIDLPNVVSWKTNNIYSANQQLKANFDEIKKSMEELVEVYQYNTMIYEAKFSFEPIVGHTYHLYKKDDELETRFLSILSPKECNFNYLGSFRLNADKIWKKIEE